MPQRHIPQRTCVACRSERPKRDMVRIVGVDSAVGVDPTGRGQAGRLPLPPAAVLAGGAEAPRPGQSLKTELTAADQALAAFSVSDPSVVGDERQERPDAQTIRGAAPEPPTAGGSRGRQ